MPMYNMLEQNGNNFMTGSFWNYYRDEMNDDANKRGIK